jgi:hypothetical protein
MFCPKCGQRQAADDVRFCSSCGFALNVVSDVLAGGGQLHWRPPEQAGPYPLTARQKGIRQGAMLMLSTLLVMPVVIFLLVSLLKLPGVLIPLAGAFCIFGGLLRILYAVFLEDDAPARAPHAAQTYVPPSAPPNYLGTPAQQNTALPPPRNAPAHRPRYNTGELAERPPSITENTTRLLDRKPDEKQ